MFTKLTLENFKNFKQAELALGPFTVLVGANATGKSNLREAFRFLQGIGRGYTLPEIIGEKWMEGGVRVWTGIRGGLNEICFSGDQYFCIQTEFFTQEQKAESGSYCTEITIDDQVNAMRIACESLGEGNKAPIYAYMQDYYRYEHDDQEEERLFNAWEFFFLNETSLGTALYRSIVPLIANGKVNLDDDVQLKSLIIEQHGEEALSKLQLLAETFSSLLVSMRFFEFEPGAMKMPSLPGQTVLGDRGENLSSVLYAIWQDPQRKQTLLSWLEEIMPGEIVDLEFPTDQIGRVLVTMVESSGQKISAYSLSDGTLRFLAMLAAFFGPERAKFYFFEELETGIHPTRLYLLTQLIENQTAQGDIQVVASTHSPLLLNYLSAKTLESASLLYRLEGEPDAHIRRILDIPHAERLIKEKGIMPLYESGWLEDAMFLIDEDEPQEPVAEAVA